MMGDGISNGIIERTCDKLKTKGGVDVTIGALTI